MRKNILVTLIALLVFVLGCEFTGATEVPYERDYLIIVNKDNPFDFKGIYAKELSNDLAETVQCTTGDKEFLEFKTLEQFKKLQIAAEEQGIKIGLLSGYRTKKDQDWLYENYTATPQVKGGYSEHHTGLNISLVVEGEDDGKKAWLSEGVKIPVSETLTKLLPEYGFIRRYPEGKEDITGHEAQAFEIRFVGSSHVAMEIMNNDLCLEEYVASRKNK